VPGAAYVIINTAVYYTGFPLSGMSGNFGLTGMSGNCQGILTYVREFLWKMAMPISAFALHCAGPMGRQFHYDLRG